VQTRLPDHPVVAALVARDPSVLARADAARREVLRRPPFSSEALISGSAAATFAQSLGNPLGVEILGPDEGRWLIRTADPDSLGAVLTSVERPGGRLRIEVDPLRV
jgi:hypothetical protein